MSDKFILEGKIAVPCSDLMKWAKWYETANRDVAKYEGHGVKVSTVFLSIDHNLGWRGQPELFETMVFGGVHDQEQKRYATWEEAQASHDAMVKLVQEAK